MADSFGDLLQQFLPKVQGVAQEAAAASPFNPATITSPATAVPAATALSGGPAGILSALVSAPLQAVSHAAGELAQIPAGSLFGPLLAPPGNAPPIASSSPQAAAGYQVGRALGAVLAGQGPAGVGEVFGQGQQAWHQPEPIMGYKGALEAPFNIFSYGGVPQGKAAGALAKAGVPGAAALEAANTLLQQAGRGAAGGLEAGVGQAVSKLLPFSLGEESVGSQKVAEAARLGNLRSSLGNLAEQGVAPPEAQGNLFGWMAEQQRAARAATPGAAPAEGAAAAGATAAPPTDFLGAMGVAPEAPIAAGTATQLQRELFAPLLRQAHNDMDIAATAYRHLGLDAAQPIEAVIAQADQAAPPLLDAIPEATRAWQAANPGKPLVNDAMFNDLLRSAEQNIAQRTGTFADEQTHWSTVLHWMQDTWPQLSPSGQSNPATEALVARRLAAERGSAPLHPALAGEPGLGAVPPAPGVAPEAAPTGIPFGRAQIDRSLLQQNIDAGMPMAEARAKAVVNVEAGGAPPAPEAGPPAPGAAPPLMEGTLPEAVPAPGRPPVPEAGPPAVAPGAAPPPAGGAPAVADTLDTLEQRMSVAAERMSDAYVEHGAVPPELTQAFQEAKRAYEAGGAAPPPAGGAPSIMEGTIPGAGAHLTETRWSSSALGVDALYHETSPRQAVMMTGNPGDLSGLYLSPQPELALGQAGRGAVVEFAPTAGLEVRAEMGKPGAAFVAEQTGQAPEYTILKNRPSDTLIRSITFETPLAPRSVEARALASEGWQPKTLPDGRMQYTNPRVAGAPPTGAAGEAALGTPSVPLTGAPAVPPAVEPPPPLQWGANGNLIAREGVAIPPEPPPLGPSGAAGAPVESPAAGPPPTGPVPGTAAPPVPPSPPPAPGTVPPGMSAEQAATLTPVQLAQVAGNDAAFFQRVMEDSPAYLDRFTKDKAAFQGIQNALAAGGPVPTTIADAQAALKGVAAGRALGAVETKRLQGTLDELARRYPNDVDLLDAAVRDAAVGQSWLFDRGQEIARSSTAPGILGWAKQPLAFWQWAMNGLRSFELFSGMQPAKHLADAYLHQLGFAGQAGIPDMGPTLWKAVTTGAEPGVGNTAAAWYASHGLSRPAEIARTAYGADIGAAGASVAPAVSMDTPLVGGVIRGGTAVKNRLDALARGADTAVREGGYQTGVDQSLAAQAPAFARQLTDLLGDAGPAIGQQFQDAKGVMTPGALRDAMATAGVAPDAMKEALLALGDVQAQANTAGLKLADKMAPGAVRITNLDEVLRYAVPFSTFASRQIPRTLELFLSNPAIWNAFRAYHEITDAQNKAEGILPGTSLAQNVLLFKIGNTRVFINPLEYLAEDRPFRQPFVSPKQAPILGDLYNRLSLQGFGPAGPVGLGITGSGLLGPAPPPELSPVDDLLSNALSWGSGQQVTMPWAAMINQRAGGKPLFAPPESIGAGVEGFDPSQEVRKRLGEMSIEETGLVNNPAYEAAARNPADPLYQRAAREVNGRELIQEALHLLGFGVKLSPESAGLISRGMAGIPMVNAAGGGAGQWTMPTMPYANAQGPLTTFADRQRMLLDRARTNPAALGYNMAYGGEQAAGPPSEYKQFTDAVRQQWASGSAADRQAILSDPRKRGVVMADWVQKAPLFQLPGARGGGQAPIQDILPVAQ